MEPTRKGILLVEKCLLCFSLRAGTFFICWWTCMYSLCLPIILIVLHLEMVKSELVLFTLSIPMLILLKGIFISGITLLHFPIPNEEYNITSASAKSLFRFAVYNGIVSVLSLVIFMIFWILSLTLFTITDGSLNPPLIDIRPVIILLGMTLPGLHVHFTAVVYSYYLSILKSDENRNQLIFDHVNLMTVNQNVETTVTLDATLPTYSECVSQPYKYLSLVHQQ